MTRSTLAFLLGLSLLFNIFFIAGAMTWRVPAEVNEATRVSRIVTELGLDGQQEEVFKSMQQQFSMESAVIGEQLSRVRQMISAELESDAPDVEELRNLSSQEASLLTDRRTMGVDQFTYFVDMLSPKQRRDLGRRLSGHPRGRHESPRKMEQRAIEKFDSNGDGLLDDAERKNARAFAKQEHEKRRMHREQTRMQFDLDGDGSLSSEETRGLSKVHSGESRVPQSPSPTS